jgi:SAD/SRA domain
VLSDIAGVSTQGSIRYRGSIHLHVERCVVITGSAKGAFYGDGWADIDTLNYTGEGRSGNQTLTRGNLALSKQSELGFPLHVFEKPFVNRYAYAGQFRVTRTYEGTMKGEDGEDRRVFRFELCRLG